MSPLDLWMTLYADLRKLRNVNIKLAKFPLKMTEETPEVRSDKRKLS